MSKPTLVMDEYGQITIESGVLALKIDKNRDILVKKIYSGESDFVSLKQRLPTGLNREQKKVYLFDLHQQIEARIISDKLAKKDAPSDEFEGDDEDKTDENVDEKTQNI